MSLRRTILLSLALPGVIYAATASFVFVNLNRLPAQVALHWNAAGQVDRVGSAQTLLVSNLVVIGLMLVVGAVTGIASWRSEINRRMGVAVANGLAILVSGLTLVTTVAQFDLADSRDASTPAAWIAVDFAAALLVALVAGSLAGADPHLPAVGPYPSDVRIKSLPPDWRGDWTEIIRPSAQGWGVLIVAIGAVFLAVLNASSAARNAWILVLVGLPLAAVIAFGMIWRIRIDRTGFTATPLAGWPTIRVPADEVERADAVDLAGGASRTGWGLRARPGGETALVLRRGRALRIRRTGGRVLTVSLADADDAARTLNTVASRVRST